jgi:DNA-binding transcriptional LysR family regulator
VHAAEAAAADEAVLSELARLSDAPRGHVRMTFVQTPALSLLPVALGHLTETAPDLQVEVVQMETAPAIDALRSRAVDLVVGVEYEPVPVPRHRDLLRESVLLTVHPDHLGASVADAISLADVQHTPWAAGHRGTGRSAVIETYATASVATRPTSGTAVPTGSSSARS